IDIKDSLPIAGRLHPAHYSLLYYSKGRPARFSRPRIPVPVCRHCGGDIKDYGGHREKLLERVLEIASQPGDVVLDPFGGSGTTYAVAERMHRHWIGVELGDCEPILRRLSGREPDVTPPRRGDAAKGMQRPGVTPPLRRDAAKGTHRGDT